MSDSSSNFDSPKALLQALELEDIKLPSAAEAALLRLWKENRNLADRVVQLESELKEALNLADRDVLCPMLNRRAFTREIEREIALATRRQTALSLLYLDLDNFKAINDKFGHKAGDEVLLEFSTALIGAVRRTDITGRLGGDEFGVLMINASKADAERQLGRISGELEEAFSANRIVSVSVGISTWKAGETVDELLASADKAMFLDKSDERP